MRERHTHREREVNRDRDENESILYPNIPPRKDPDALTFLSASAISCMASFSLPELSMASWVCRWRRDGRKTGRCSAVDGEEQRRAEERRGEERREMSSLVLMLMLRGLRLFFYGERERSFAARCHHLLERTGNATVQ